MALSAGLRSGFGRRLCPETFSENVSCAGGTWQLEARCLTPRLTADIVKQGHCPRNFTNTLLALIPMNEDTEALIPLMCGRFENARLRWIRHFPPHSKQVQALSRAMWCVSPRAWRDLFLGESKRGPQFASAQPRKKERV
jgi:hypothetical protein